MRKGKIKKGMGNLGPNYASHKVCPVFGEWIPLIGRCILLR